MEGRWEGRGDGGDPSDKDYYKILEVSYDATDEDIKSSYRRLARRWHPDKHKDIDSMTAKFQEINEAYEVLSNPDKRIEYDICSSYLIERYTLREYLSRFKGMILTCNGLGINHSPEWLMAAQLERLESLCETNNASCSGW